MRSRRITAVVALAVGLVFAAAGGASAVPGSVIGHKPLDDDGGQVTWAVATADTEQGTGRANSSYSVDPGTQLSDAIVITNKSAGEQTLAVYATDAVTTAEGTLDLLPRAQVPTDAGTWVSFDTDQTDQVVVGAGESVTVPFTVTIPDSARPGDHSAGIVTSLVSAGSGGTVTVDRRLGLRMHLRVAGELTQAAEIRDLRVDYLAESNPLAAGSARVSYTIVNTGNTRITGIESVSVAGMFGMGQRTRHGDDLGEIVVGGEVRREVVLEGVIPGVRLTAQVTLLPVSVGIGAAAGTDAGQAATAESSVWAIPWLVVIAAVLIIAVVLFMIFGPGLRDRRRLAHSRAPKRETQTADASRPHTREESSR